MVKAKGNALQMLKTPFPIIQQERKAMGALYRIIYPVFVRLLTQMPE
jgi:hypothetical protein